MTRLSLQRLLIPIFCLAAVSPLVAQDEAALLADLSSASPARRAMAGHQAAKKKLKPVAREIARLIREEELPGGEPDIRIRVLNAWTDALIQNEIVLSGPKLEELEKAGVGRDGLLALAAADPTRAEEWLLGLLRQEEDAQVWAAAAVLLCHGKSKKLAGAILRDWDATVEVYIEGENGGGDAIGLGAGMGGRGARRAKPPEGFPPLVDYVLSHRPRRGVRNLGFRDCPVLCERRPSSARASKRNLWPLKASREWYHHGVYVLTRLAGLEQDRDVLDREWLSFESSVDPRTVAKKVDEARRQLHARYWLVVRKLVESDLLAVDVARKLAPAFPVRLGDLRGEGAAALPPLDEPLPRPAWLEED